MNIERIMVVDDDDLVRTGLALDLEDEGYEVITARSAEEALDRLETHQVELILSDLVMAEMDGLGLLRHARARWPQVGFIVITGHGTVGRALEAMQRGANDFIQKPAEPAIIRERIRSLLDDVRLRSAMVEDRRKDRQRREDMQKRMIRDQRMISLSRLAEGVSGYLANVLKPVLKHTRELGETLPADHPTLNELKDIHYAHRKAEALIEDLHIIGHGARMPMQPVHLDEFLRRTLNSPEFMELRNIMPGIRIQLNCPAHLPAIMGSEKALAAVIINLAAHAIEGMPHGGLLQYDLYIEEVEAGAFPLNDEGSGRYVALRVGDTSPYAPAQDMDRVFEPFQPRRINDHMSSTGLSLSVVYRVVQEHHGFIDVQTQAGSGNAYIMYFPAATVSNHTEEPAQGMVGNETILVLDDNPEHRQRAAGMLERLGYHVITAENGHVAVDLVRQASQSGGARPIHLAILDLVLGDAFDGLETYKEIQEIEPGQKAILVSGFAEFSRIVEARKLGLGRYVQKPYRLEALGQAVRAELDH